MNPNRPMTLREKLRANIVKRWHIVDTYRPQTIAEHSFNMCLLVEEICLLCNKQMLIPEAITYAIHHDIPEVMTGDIPSPTKKCYGIDDVHENEVLDHKSITGNEFILYVVKLADLLDAVMFLQLYGVGRHSRDIRGAIVQQISELLHGMTNLKLQLFVDDIISWETMDDEGDIL